MKKTLLPLLVSALLSFLADAQSLNDVACSIAVRNPEVAAAMLPGRAEVEEALAETVLPDPTLELEQLWGAGDYGNKFTISASQEFAWPSLYASRRKAAMAQDDALELLRLDAFCQKALEAKQTILELIYNKRSLAILKAVDRNLDSLATAMDKAHQGGELTVLDINKMRIERANLLQRIGAVERRIFALNGALEALGATDELTSLASSFTDYPAEPLHDEAYYIDLANSANPRLRYNTALDGVDNLRLKSLRAEQLPVISLGYTFNYEDGNMFNGIGASMSLPFYSRAHSRRAIELQRQERQTSSLGVAVEETSRIRADYTSALDLEAQLAMLQPVVSDPRNKSLLRKAFDGGALSVLEYIEEMNYFLEADLMLEELVFNKNLTISSLNKYSLLE